MTTTPKETWIAAQPKGCKMPLAQLLELAAKHGVKFSPFGKSKAPMTVAKEGGGRALVPGVGTPDAIKAMDGKSPWLGIQKPADHGLVIIDVDIKNAPESEAGLAELDEMLAKLDEAADGAVARSQSGGRHYYFRAPKGLRNKPTLYRTMPTGDELRGTPWVETRSNSPAIAYELEQLPAGAFPELPAWLLLAISPPSRKKAPESSAAGPPTAWDGPDAILRAIEDAPEGERNNTLYRLGVQFLREAGITDEAEAALAAAGVRSGLAEEEVAGVVASVLARAGEPTYYELQQARLAGLREAVKAMWEKYPAGHVSEGEWIPLRPADVFVRHWPDCRYFENKHVETLEKRGIWLEIVDSARWARVKKSEVERRVRQVVKVLRGVELPSKELNEEVAATMRELVAAAVSGTTDQVDQALAVLDSTGLPLSLERGRVGPVAPRWDQPMLRRLGVAYDPDADPDGLYAVTAAECRAGGWADEHQAELMACDERIDGFELLPRKPEKWVVFEVGGGDNGKSLLAETKIKYQGEFGHVMNPAPLLEDYRQELLTGLNSMIGKRVSIVEEVPAGKYLETPTLKMISGGSMQEVRERFEDNKNVRFGSLLRFLSNTRPAFRDTSKGWRDRLLLWTYKNEFTDARGNVDKMLAEKLAAPAAGSGWLNRALRGLRSFYEVGGIRPPLCLRQDTAAYAQERGSQVKTFCEYFLERDKAADDIPVKVLRAACAAWLGEQGVIEDVRDVREVRRVIGSAKAFGDELQDITGAVVVGNARTRMLYGYRVNEAGLKYLAARDDDHVDVNAVRINYAAGPDPAEGLE